MPNPKSGTKGHKHTAQSRAKMSRAKMGKKKSAEHRTNIGLAGKGRKPSNKTRAKISRSLKGRKVSTETRAKMSQAMKGNQRCVLAIREGRYHPEQNCHQYKSGDFYSRKNGKTLHHRSQLELSWYQVLETLEKVHRYYVEPTVIPYEWEGAIHHYLPDLRIRYTDGTTELVEIKPENQWDLPQNQAKWKAAKAWCEGRKIPTVFRVVGYEELN